MSRFKPKKNKLDTDVGIDISLLPPCRSSLYLHAKRCNYQSAIWRRATDRNLNISKPTNHGWIMKYGVQCLGQCHNADLLEII